MSDSKSTVITTAKSEPDKNIEKNASEQAAATATALPAPNEVLNTMSGLLGLPGFILTTFFPSVLRHMSKYPRLTKFITISLTISLASTLAVSKILAIWEHLMSYVASSVTINSEDYLYSCFRRWQHSKYMMIGEHAMVAESEGYARIQGRSHRSEREGKNEDIVLIPQNDFQMFRHEGRFFFLTKDKSKLADPADEPKTITIRCFGWSPQPIRSILDTAYSTHKQKDSRTTTAVYRPDKYGDYWRSKPSKPLRPLDTVDLRREQKVSLLADIGEYLSPKASDWYAERGIPHRRGYLFHGPPGTGKSSMAMALAGHFGLDIYMLSLLDGALSDAILSNLFSNLPNRVLVLLEDVDSAGVGREASSESQIGDSESIEDVKKILSKPHSKVTLSGLLNSIDGVSAPEGHLLIMTTNTLEDLDEALVRPGRCDFKVHFGRASQSQARSIFIRMYKEDRREEAADGKAIEQGTTESSSSSVLELADLFGQRVPDGKFSPAELQNFILLRKSQPQRAVDEVEDWVQEVLQERAKTEATRRAAAEKRSQAATAKQTSGELAASIKDGVKADTKQLTNGVLKDALADMVNGNPSIKVLGT